MRFSFTAANMTKAIIQGGSVYALSCDNRLSFPQPVSTMTNAELGHVIDAVIAHPKTVPHNAYNK